MRRIAIEELPLISSVRYPELEPGMRWGPFEHVLQAHVSDQLRGEVGVRGASLSAAPPAMLPVLFLSALRRALHGIPPGGILARQSFRVDRSLPSEGPVLVEVGVSDQYELRGRLYTVFEFDVRLDDGRTAAGGTMAIVAPERAS